MQSNINRYKKDKKHKEQVAEMQAKGMEMLDRNGGYRMSSKRKFTNEEIEALVKRSEGISIGQLAREIGVNKSTLQSNINRYKKSSSTH